MSFDDVVKKVKENLDEAVVILVGQRILSILRESDMPLSTLSATALRLVAFEIESIVDKIDNPKTTMKELQEFMESDAFIESCAHEVRRLMADKK
jgi:hypothetical protein